MNIRQEHHFRRDSLIAGEAVDLTTYDRVGRYGAEAKAFLCAENELPQFLFTGLDETTYAEDEAIAVAFLGQGQVQLRLSGTGSAGQKIKAGANGLIVASDTNPSGEFGTNDFGVALEDWTDGVPTECDLIKGEQLA